MTIPSSTGADVQVPPGHIWLEGDNLIVSRDSREYGPVPLALVRGRAVVQVRHQAEVRRGRLCLGLGFICIVCTAVAVCTSGPCQGQGGGTGEAGARG